MPIDQPSDGTWIAVNDAGVIATLLNRNDSAAANGRSRCDELLSRGTIIPQCMHAQSADEAADIVAKLEASIHAPFRLLLIDDAHLIDVTSDGLAVTQAIRQPLGHVPLMFASSGLGDELVDAPRRELFNHTLIGAPADALLESQRAFHAHQWADRPELSVCMSRADARTVSLTTVATSDKRIELTYHPAPPGEPAVDTAMSMARCGADADA